MLLREAGAPVRATERPHRLLCALCGPLQWPKSDDITESGREVVLPLSLPLTQYTLLSIDPQRPLGIGMDPTVLTLSICAGDTVGDIEMNPSGTSSID